jgi:NTP pyrophosphatase (non-canonical NTP hydrolase)
MHETQQTIGQWAIDTFPGEPGLIPRHCLRLLEEVIELCLVAGAHVDDIKLTQEREIERWTNKHAQRGVQYERYPEPEKIPGELADCDIVLMTLAHRAGIDLQAERDKKMAINRARKWAVDGLGCGQHID